MAKGSWTTKRIATLLLSIAFIVAGGFAMKAIYTHKTKVKPKPNYVVLQSTDLSQVKFAHEGPPDAVTGFRDRHVYLITDPKAMLEIRKMTNRAKLISTPNRKVPALCQPGAIYGIRFVYTSRLIQEYDPIKTCSGVLYGPLSGDRLPFYFKDVEAFAKENGFEVDPNS